jgi:hypothetical protein
LTESADGSFCPLFSVRRLPYPGAGVQPLRSRPDLLWG